MTQAFKIKPQQNHEKYKQSVTKTMLKTKKYKTRLQLF